MTHAPTQPRDRLERFGPRLHTPAALTFDAPYTAETLDSEENAGGYFCPVQNQGRIVPSKLTDESYKDFGFLPPDAVRTCAFSKEDGADVIAQETAHLDGEARGALLAYAELEYEDINRYLRTGVSRDHTDQENEAMRDLLDESLERRGAQRIVYRREGQKAADVAGLALGDEIVHSAYISTSYDPHNGPDQEDEDYDAVILEIKTSSGVNISNIARFEETEVVLPRDLRFRVVGVHRDVTFSAAKTQVPYDRGQAKPGAVSTFRSHTIVQMVEVDVDGRIVE